MTSALRTAALPVVLADIITVVLCVMAFGVNLAEGVFAVHALAATVLVIALVFYPHKGGFTPVKMISSILLLSGAGLALATATGTVAPLSWIGWAVVSVGALIRFFDSLQVEPS